MQFPVSHPDDGLIDISIQEIVRPLPHEGVCRRFFTRVP